MADLGTLASVATGKPEDIRQSVSALIGSRYNIHAATAWISTTRPAPPDGSLVGLVMPHSSQFQKQAVATKRVAGVVKEYGVNVSRVVRAYARSTGVLLGEATSNATTGVFAISIYNFSGEVFVVAFDDTGANPDLNAQIFDRVTPV